MAVEAGRLRARITIERYGETRDAIGGITETWSTLKKVWARVRAKSGTEIDQGGRVDAKTVHEIKIRFTDITQRDRITWKGRVFNIVRVLEADEYRRELMIEAVEDV